MFSNCCCARKSDWRPKFVAIHEEANHRVVHEHGLGETNGFAGQAFEARTERQMFAFDLLGVDFADGMSSGGKMTVINPGGIGVKMFQPKGLEQLVQLDKHLIRPTPKRIRQDHSREMINGVPQPTPMSLVLHKTPHLINLRRLNSANFHGKGV
jgi:hypothetical protein